MGEVVLFDGEVSRGTSSHAAVKFTESGDLQLSVQDVGEAPRQFWGDSDYEWWVTVRAQQVPRLLELLRGESSIPAAADDDLLALIGSELRRSCLRAVRVPGVAGAESRSI